MADKKVTVEIELSKANAALAQQAAEILNLTVEETVSFLPSRFNQPLISNHPNPGGFLFTIGVQPT